VEQSSVVIAAGSLAYSLTTQLVLLRIFLNDRKTFTWHDGGAS